jgi:hypothetical protein
LCLETSKLFILPINLKYWTKTGQTAPAGFGWMTAYWGCSTAMARSNAARRMAGTNGTFKHDKIMRINIPSNPDDLIALGNAIYAQHTKLGAASPLNGINGVAGLPPSIRLPANHYAPFLFTEEDVERFKAEQKNIANLLEERLEPDYENETVAWVGSGE